jgi:hypothetical protein
MNQNFVIGLDILIFILAAMLILTVHRLSRNKRIRRSRPVSLERSPANVEDVAITLTPLQLPQTPPQALCRPFPPPQKLEPRFSLEIIPNPFLDSQDSVDLESLVSSHPSTPVSFLKLTSSPPPALRKVQTFSSRVSSRRELQAASHTAQIESPFSTTSLDSCSDLPHPGEFEL